MVKLEMDAYNINEILSSLDFFSYQYVTCRNGLMLTNYEVDILNKYHIDYEQCMTLGQLLLEIENYFYQNQNLELEDLDNVSSSISERCYYQEVNR